MFSQFVESLSNDEDFTNEKRKKITIPLFIPAHVISLIRLENIIKIGTQSGMEDPKPKPNHLLETGLDAHICIHQINQFRCFVPKSNYTYFAPNK